MGPDLKTLNLAIFDIDGTLTETDEVDEICFVQALADTHGITGISTTWAAYPHTTDSGITRQIFQENFDRVPTNVELKDFQSRFVNLLEEYCQKDAASFDEISGASSTLRRLNEEPDWKVAIASGSWRVSGALKLKHARIDLDHFPSSFADDGLSREEILNSAVQKAQLRYEQANFDRIVSVGDGLWDVRTARNLGFPFVGIGREERSKRLFRAGATHVLRDLADYNEVIRCLVEADVPQSVAQV